jgi:hypothetical protein
LEAQVALDTVDVILSGPLPLLESLGPDDIFVILDLTGLLPGNHIIEPRVVVPTGIEAEGVIPETVEVIITPTAPQLEGGGPPITPTAVITGPVNGGDEGASAVPTGPVPGASEAGDVEGAGAPADTGEANPPRGSLAE